MHAAAVVGKQRLGHEGGGLAVLVGHVADNVLEQPHVVRRLHQRVIPLIDLRLPAGGDLVMVALDVEAALHHGLGHLAAQVLVVVRRRHREVPFLVARAVAEVVPFPAGIPTPFLGVDVVEAGVLVLVEADAVEDEELGFGPEVGCVRQPAALQVQLRLLGDPARVALIVLAGDRIDHVGERDNRGRLGKRIHEYCRRIGEHVALVDGRPAANAGAVKTVALFEDLFRQFVDRIGNVVGQSRQIGKAYVDLLDVVLLGIFQYFFRGHLSSVDDSTTMSLLP